MQKAAMFYSTEGDYILCKLCPHFCKISESKTGLCGVRQNIDGELFAMSYGEVSSIALDPIEKKPLKEFYPGSIILSLGSYGCNLKCNFCQNHSISMQKPETKYVAPHIIAEIALKYSQHTNIGVAYTYNEPFISYEYMLDCAKLLHELNLKNVIVTNGYINEKPLMNILPYIDAMNIDLKSFSNEFYKKCGGGLEAVKNTIATAIKHCHVEVTTLVIPNENDTVEEIGELSKWLASLNESIPLHLTRFYPKYKMTKKDPTEVSSLEALRSVAIKHLKKVYI